MLPQRRGRAKSGPVLRVPAVACWPHFDLGSGVERWVAESQPTITQEEFQKLQVL